MSTSRTTVVNVYRDAYDVYIGRPGKGQDGFWGNPFSTQSRDPAFLVRTHDEAVDMHAKWLQTQPHLLAKIPELRGKRLGCFCAPRRCHGDNLATLADKDHPDNALLVRRDESQTYVDGFPI